MPNVWTRPLGSVDLSDMSGVSDAVKAEWAVRLEGEANWRARAWVRISIIVYAAAILLALAGSAQAAANFTVVWAAQQPSGAQWVTVTHVPSGRVFPLKASLAVRFQWLPAAERAALLAQLNALPTDQRWPWAMAWAAANTARWQQADCVSAGNVWLLAQAQAYLADRTAAESPTGVRDAAIAAATMAAQQALQAKAVCDALKAQYPDYAAKIPTITVDLGK